MRASRSPHPPSRPAPLALSTAGPDARGGFREAASAAAALPRWWVRRGGGGFGGGGFRGGFGGPGSAAAAPRRRLRGRWFSAAVPGRGAGSEPYRAASAVTAAATGASGSADTAAVMAGSRLRLSRRLRARPGLRPRRGRLRSRARLRASNVGLLRRLRRRLRRFLRRLRSVRVLRRRLRDLRVLRLRLLTPEPPSRAGGLARRDGTQKEGPPERTGPSSVRTDGSAEGAEPCLARRRTTPVRAPNERPSGRQDNLREGERLGEGRLGLRGRGTAPRLAPDPLQHRLTGVRVPGDALALAAPRRSARGRPAAPRHRPRRSAVPSSACSVAARSPVPDLVDPGGEQPILHSEASVPAAEPPW